MRIDTLARANNDPTGRLRPIWDCAACLHCWTGRRRASGRFTRPSTCPSCRSASWHIPHQREWDRAGGGVTVIYPAAP